MNQLTSQDSDIKSSIFATGEVNLDEISFSAIDEGLGFHHKEKTLKVGKSTRAYEINNQKIHTSKDIAEISVPSVKSDHTLSDSEISISEAFAGISQKDELQSDLGHKELDTPGSSYVESSLEKVSAAWAVDLFLITISIVSALVLFTTATNINLDDFYSFISLRETQLFISTFFIIFYLLYFSVLDLNSSPGKLLFGTRLVSINGDRLTVFQTFIRALVILLSVPLFMLPLIFGLHNKMSDTLSVEEKW